MKKSRLLVAMCACLVMFSIKTNAALVIENLSITSSNVSFDMSGIVDVAGPSELDSFLFGVVGNNTSWINTLTSQGSFSKNGGTYDFTSVWGRINDSDWGTYLFTNGADTIVVGDVVDISYSINGSFNPGLIDANNFVVQAGVYSSATHGKIIQAELITGGVSTVPLPATVWLFGSGLLGLIGVARKKTA